MTWLINREDWLRLYQRVQSIIPGLSYYRDQEAADILSRLLSRHSGVISVNDLLEAINWAHVGYVIGCGENAERELELLEERRDGVVIAANGATRLLLERGIIPHVVTSDIDGDIEAIMEASRRGSIIVVHAHGDNIPLLEAIVPRIPGRVIGSTQVEPRPYVYNFGGFTDGDRALFILYTAGVKRAILIGFDFEKPFKCPGKRVLDTNLKKLKLEAARLMVNYLVEKGMTIESQSGESWRTQQQGTSQVK